MIKGKVASGFDLTTSESWKEHFWVKEVEEVKIADTGVGEGGLTTPVIVLADR